MANQWNLHVRDFGKIKEATIKVSPFMVFVGENNSGKSYTMLLLWGIVTRIKKMVIERLDKHPSYRELYSKFQNLLQVSPEETLYQIDSDLQSEILQILNDILYDEKDRLVKHIFKYSVPVGSLKITRDEALPLSVEVSSEIQIIHEYSASEDMEATPVEKKFFHYTVFYNENRVRRALRIHNLDEEFDFGGLIKYLAVSLICLDYYDDNFDPESLLQPLYFPASRTGFMHTYRTIIGNVFRTTTEEMESIEVIGEDGRAVPSIVGAELSLPTTNFLFKLQKHGFDADNQERYKEELTFLSEEIMGGKIAKDDMGHFRFIPANTESRLPMHVSSSLVAEIAPLYIFLGSHYRPKLWIIEELEAHLHSEKQLKMARLMVRLLNKGNAVWLTTHSDNLGQQINNLLTLSQRSNRAKIIEKLQYHANDLFQDVSMVNAYQFEVHDGATVVEQLELGRYGFEMRTFNDTLKRIIQETDIIQNFSGE